MPGQTVEHPRRSRRLPSARLVPALAACLLGLGALSVACGNSAQDRPTQPTGQPDITGTVTSATSVTNGDMVGSFLVEGGKDDYDKASVTVTVRTGWFRRDGDAGYVALARPTGQELANKTVAVQFTGPVAESYPVQATADWVIVED